MRLFTKTLLIAAGIVFTSTQGLIRVGVNQDMCNSASEVTSTRSKGILDQLNDHTALNGEHTMQASWTWDSLMNSDTCYKQTDVFYLGPGGADLDSNKMTESPALRFAKWLTEDKYAGAVITSHGHVSMGSGQVQTYLSQIMPVNFAGYSKYCKPLGSNPIQMTLNESMAGHYLTRNLPKTWKMSSHCYVSPQGHADDAVSVASVSAGSGACYESTVSSGSAVTLSKQFTEQAVMYKVLPNGGRIVWLCAPYCGYDLYQPFNLRSGPDEIIFANALEWASGLCKDLNDCYAHGSCSGLNKCECDPGYAGEDCSGFNCPNGCGGDEQGTCSGPNKCTCKGNWAGDTCSECAEGWYGASCTVPQNIKDGTFTENDKWWSGSGKDAISGGQISFSSANKEVEQTAYFAKRNSWNEENMFVVFDVTIPDTGCVLEVYVDGNLLWTSSDNKEVTIGTECKGYVNIESYADSNNNGHTVRFVAKSVTSGKKIIVKNIVNGRGDCSEKGCINGVCRYESYCACNDHWEGEKCDAAVCGDGYIIYNKEACDDGNTADGDGCNSTCQVERGFTCEGMPSVCTPICGDGLVRGGEGCDDGNTVDGDGCSSTCKVEIGCECTGEPSKCSWKCGNNFISGTEECDSSDSISGCTNCIIDNGWDCKLSNYSAEAIENGPSFCMEEKCGDGSKTRSEECDDGDIEDGDGCDKNCKIEPGWECTVAEIWGNSTCKEVCGNSKISASEECDDGNTVDGDGCSSDCKIEPGWYCGDRTLGSSSVCTEKCGDGKKTRSEECDDGNNKDGDGCSSTCKLEDGWDCNTVSMKSECQKEVCGDGIRTRSEKCDNGDLSSDGTTGCTMNCTVTYGWACDPNDFWDKSDCHEVCGNGIKTHWEVCDDGNNLDNYTSGKEDGCNRFCNKTDEGWKCQELDSGISYCYRLCGDGKRTADEECDDGNQNSGDGCSWNCQIEYGWACNPNELGKKSVCKEVCGDTIITHNEECDDGNAADGDGCSSTCKIERGYTCKGTPSVCTSVCGDGTVANNEGCDDGNTVDGDGCSSTCKIEDGWECREDNFKSTCQKIGCGNGVTTSDEECDDGNNKDGDGCSSTCKIEDGWDCVSSFTSVTSCLKKVCGDGKRTSDEECDDGNNKDRDGCSSDCKKEKGVVCLNNNWGQKSNCNPQILCGNGLLTSNEECDDENTVDGDGCSSDCKIEDGWLCRVGPGRTVSYYYPSVCHERICGDGILEGPEECDDGNTVDGDGCSNNCTLEYGYSCIGKKCRSYCGNGVVGEGEECDDGNVFNGDGCSSNCTVEEGWTCTTTDASGLSVCSSTCGDGIVASNEECDDNNTYSGDGCSWDCKVEDKYRCSGAPSFCMVRLTVNHTSVTVVRNNTCAGLMDGEIEAEMSVIINKNFPDKSDYTAEYKITGPGYEFAEFTPNNHWKNLASGKYTIYFYIDRNLENNITVTISEPSTLNGYFLGGDESIGFKMPSTCDAKDGYIKVVASGGVPPYTFYLGEKTSDSGIFEDLGYKDYNTTRIVDANKCTYVFSDTRREIECNFPKMDKFLRDVWARGGSSGVTVLAVVVAVIIVLIVCYWVWDWKAFKKDQKDQKQFNVEMDNLKQ